MRRSALSLSLLCAAALLASAARAEMPAGAYTISILGDNALVFPSGTIENQCESTPDGLACASSDVHTDASGAVSGTGTLTLTGGDVTLDLGLALEGQISGTTVKPKTVVGFTAEGDGSYQGIPLTVTGGGRLKCAIDPTVADQLFCKGRAKLCVYMSGEKLGCTGLPFATSFAFERTPFDISLDLATDPKNGVTGDAQVLINAAPAFDYTAKGKYKPKTDTTTLKLVGVDPAAKTKIALKSALLEGGGASSGTVVFKVAGMKGTATLPLVTLAGRGQCMPGGFCDVNQDTSGLFGQTPSPVIPDDTIFFGILDAASRAR